MDLTELLSEELNLEITQITNTLSLLQEGATIPFIARYRKERTGNLNESQIKDLFQKYRYYTELEERRATILKSIESQNELTPELAERIKSVLSKTELEDLYLPFKPKRATLATKARDAGLEPLARWLYQLRDSTADIVKKAQDFLNQAKGIDSTEKAIQGAGYILAEELAENAEVRKWLRELAQADGVLKSKVRKKFVNQKSKFQMYYDFAEKVRLLPSHRILAMLRGEREKILAVKLVIPEQKTLAYLEKKFIQYPDSAAAPLLTSIIKDSWERLLLSATETEVRKQLRERADEEAIKVFSENLEVLLLAPPAGQKPVLGIDPGFRTGCKLAALDKTGKMLEYQTIFPHEPQKKINESVGLLRRMLHDHEIQLIAIGNGTASRETEDLVRLVLKDLSPDQRPACIMISEAGASVYSASEVAREEFPDHDVTVRGAVSIGRRLQDPLAELVKIDPKSIGIGQYQHDVNQIKLRESLEGVVESCVNRVGVNLNLASAELLKYVAGLNRTSAKNIVEHRNEHGIFQSREGLKKISGLGAKAFEQSAGFLRIPGARNPLDNSAVHPERYPLVREMAVAVHTSLEKLIGNPELIQAIPKDRFVSQDVGVYTLNDILSELEKPGRDPRDKFQYASFAEGIMSITDLSPGMVLEGNVTNVTNFGAFVDIGIHQDGLVHISQLADCYVDDPRKFVKVGQIVKVKVMNVEEDLKRISLSMRFQKDDSNS